MATGIEALQDDDMLPVGGAVEMLLDEEDLDILPFDQPIGENGEMGVVEIDLDPNAAEDRDDIPFDANLAEHMDDSELGVLASELMTLFDSDLRSRREWNQMYIEGLKILGLTYEKRTIPFDNACGVVSPLLLEAGIRFQSEMITETFPAAGPVKTQIIGETTRQTEEAAERVREDMNWRLTEQMVEYRPEHERMLFSLGLAGAAFKKVYKDEALGRQVSMYVTAEDLVMPYGASSVYTAERVTHIMRKTKNEARKEQVSGFYRDIELGDPVRISDDGGLEDEKAEKEGVDLIDDNRFQFLEFHVEWELKGFELLDADGEPTGVGQPYIITVERGSNKVLGIRRNWVEDDAKFIKRQHFVQYNYVPGFGAYGMGFIHIIGGYARAGTSIIRQLVDAGTLANLPGGLKSRGLRVKDDATPIEPGEFRDVDVPVGTVRDNIMLLPYKEPSQVLAALLEQVTEDGRRLAAIGDLKISDMSAQAPVGTTLALLERQLKVMSAVQARTHASLRMEFKLLKEIVRDEMPETYDYTPAGGNPKAKKADYALVEVIPVSDPNAATMAQRIMQYQAAMQMADKAQQIYDLPYLHRQMLEVLGIKNAERLVPIEEDMLPKDPISENMAFLISKPTKAFIHQDHEAHIAAHTSMMQDPTVMQMLGQTPMAQQVMGAIMAHVAQHVAFRYRTQIEQQMGVPLPAPDTAMEPQVEAQLSRLVAQAATQLLQSNMQKAQAQQAQQQAQQAAQDPKAAAAMATVEVKKQDLAQRAAADQREHELERQRLELQAAESRANDKREAARLAAQVKMNTDRVTSQERQNAERVRAQERLAATNAQAQERQNTERTASQERQTDKKIRADVVKTVTQARNKPAPGKPGGDKGAA